MSSRLSVDERLKIIEFFTSCQSIMVTQQKFRTSYNKKNEPTRKSIKIILAKFNENDSVTDQQLGASGRPRFVCNLSNYDKIEGFVEHDPKLNIRELAQSLSIMKKHPSIELLEKN